MCDPVTATALALSAGGTMLQSRESNKNAQRVMDAKNAAFQTGMGRQTGYAQEGGQAFATNTQAQGRDAFDAQKAQETDKYKQAFATNQASTPIYNAGTPASTPKNVVIAQRAATDKADAMTNRDVNNMANLNSYSGAMFNQGIDQNKFARLFGNLQDKAGHDAALIPLDMDAAANNASKAPSLFPMLLKAGGQALGMYSAGSGTTSFFDKGAPVSGVGPIHQPGLFTNMRRLPSKMTGGLYNV